MPDAGLPQVKEFFAQYRIRKYSKGQILIFSGDNPGIVFFLEKGSVKQYDVSYKGDEVILNIFKPPAFFPMSLAINKSANPYIFEADTDVELRQAPAEDVVKFLKVNPEVQFDLLSRLYKGIDGLLGRMSHIMTSSAKNRLIYELVIESKRFGTIQANGSCKLKLNEKDLGARAGLSRETVNREISKLKKEDLITVRQSNMIIKSVADLEKKLESTR